jgi:hypothetical protein
MDSGISRFKQTPCSKSDNRLQAAKRLHPTGKRCDQRFVATGTTRSQGRECRQRGEVSRLPRLDRRSATDILLESSHLIACTTPQALREPTMTQRSARIAVG